MQRRSLLSHGRGADARLRSSVLRLGETLGWQRHEVQAFTEALTARPWQRCGQAEFEQVLREYGDIALAIAAKCERRRNRQQGDDDAPGA